MITSSTGDNLKSPFAMVEKAKRGFEKRGSSLPCVNRCFVVLLSMRARQERDLSLHFSGREVRSRARTSGWAL